MFPLLSLIVIITGMTFSYVVNASKGNFSPFNRLSSNESSEFRLENPILGHN